MVSMLYQFKMHFCANILFIIKYLNIKVSFDYPVVMIDKLFLRADDIELAVSCRLFCGRQQFLQDKI